MICDASNQEMIQTFWESTNELSNDSLYFSKDFCQYLVDSNIRASFDLIIYLKRYLENLNELINCVTPNKIYHNYEIPMDK